MTNPSLETFKAFLQDKAIQEKYNITAEEVAEAGPFGKPTDKMIVVLIREMVNNYFTHKSTNITAKHLTAVLSNRL